MIYELACQSSIGGLFSSVKLKFDGKLMAYSILRKKGSLTFANTLKEIKTDSRSFFLFSTNRFTFYPILNGLSKLSYVIITHSVDSFGDSAHINMFCKVIVRVHERAGTLM